MEKTFTYGNVKVKVIDNSNQEVKRQRLEQAVNNFYKQIKERTKEND